MGCFKRIGCVMVIAVLVVVAWMMRDFWAGRSRVAPPPRSAASPEIHWDVMTPVGADRAQAQLDSMRRPVGPVFANIAAGDLAALIFKELRAQLPESADPTLASVMGDHLFVNATIQLKDIGPDRDLGPLSAVLAQRTKMEFGGTLGVVKSGLAEYRVTSLKLGDLQVPGPMIPKVLDHLNRSRVVGMSPDALPFTVPPYIADIRVHGSKITVYRSGS
jgi:hypothetical protein